MGERRRSSQAAASGAEGGCDEAVAGDLTSRALRWKSEHPAKDCVGRPLRILTGPPPGFLEGRDRRGLPAHEGRQVPRRPGLDSHVCA
eukprot:7144718-Pyramimonas_sp.AAC.1